MHIIYIHFYCTSPFSDLFDFLNTKALQDDGFITKFVSVICSRQIESFTINGKIARHATLEILQKNFQSESSIIAHIKKMMMKMNIIYH